MSKALPVAVAVVVAAAAGSAVALTAGATSHTRSPAAERRPAPSAPAPSAAAASATAPAGWLIQRSPTGATLAAPPSWRAAPGDRNTLSAVEPGAGGTLRGYLNLTPRQGDESVAQWKRFRLNHLRGDGEHAVRTIAYSPNVRLAAGHAACLTDAYTTSTGARYEEQACIVEGRRTAVVLGAAPPALWPMQGPVIAEEIASARP